MSMFGTKFASPLGEMFAAVREDGALVRLDFLGSRSGDYLTRELGTGKLALVWDEARCAGVRSQVLEYFDGKRRVFDLDVSPEGTEFQRRVWEQLRMIPFGATVTYGEVALRMGDAKLVRAVGGANGANPIAIVIPCHRVIGADGGLVGYGGGLQRKAALLRLEGVPVSEPHDEGSGAQLALEFDRPERP